MEWTDPSPNRAARVAARNEANCVSTWGAPLEAAHIAGLRANILESQARSLQERHDNIAGIGVGGVDVISIRLPFFDARHRCTDNHRRRVLRANGHLENLSGDAAMAVIDAHDKTLPADLRGRVHTIALAPLQVNASLADRSFAREQIERQLARAGLKLERFRDLAPAIAEAVYLGVATDTGWFRYSNMKSSTMRLAADLIDAGVDHNRLYRTVEQADTPHRLDLMRRALESLELLDHDRAAMITITKADIEACRASQDEVGGLTDLPAPVELRRDQINRPPCRPLHLPLTERLRTDRPRRFLAPLQRRQALAAGRD